MISGMRWTCSGVADRRLGLRLLTHGGICPTPLMTQILRWKSDGLGLIRLADTTFVLNPALMKFDGTERI